MINSRKKLPAGLALAGEEEGEEDEDGDVPAKLQREKSLDTRMSLAQIFLTKASNMNQALGGKWTSIPRANL